MTGNLLLRRAGRGLGRRPDGGATGSAAPRLYEADTDARHLRATARARRRPRAAVHRPAAVRPGGRARPRTSSTPYFAARLGIEPLSGELTPRRCCELAAGRRAPLKSFLLDQTGIAGIGNIYADEALLRARLHPLSPAGSMRLEHCEELRDGIVEALEAGLANGGSSIDDYRDARGERGVDAGRVPRPHARGRAVPALRRDDPADRGRRPLDLLLPGLPAAAAAPRRAARGGGA